MEGDFRLWPNSGQIERIEQSAQIVLAVGEHVAVMMHVADDQARLTREPGRRVS